MASNNIILAVPSANSSVNYDLPSSDSAKLSFSPQDIDGLKLDGKGGLVISFVEGGNVTLTNFQSFIDNGNTLSLSDGTQVDPKLLFNALGGQNDNLALGGGEDVIKIGIPAENSQRDIALEPGKKYLLNFDLSETQGADVKDGKMVIGFENGGKIVITNYESAMADKMPPELSLASKTCVVTGDQLITDIQNLAKTNPLEQTVVVVEEEQADAKRKSKVSDADMEGKEDIGANGETDLAYKAEQAKAEAAQSEAKAREANEIKTAAGEEAIAQQLANIETAAGGPAGGRSNSGYGYGSRFAPDPFVTNPDIGPIDPTQLNYRAPILQPSAFLIDQDGNPLMIQPNALFLDETNLSGGPIVVNGTLSIDYGADGFGSLSPDGSFTSGGSQTGNNLSSNGVDIVVNQTANGYEGFAGGVKVFDLVINANGSYTFTQYEQLDHANGSDPNDQIALNFGVIARDGDGDSVSTTIQIVIADDAPTASGASETIDETNLGPIVETGSITVNFGQDGAGSVQTTNDFTAGGSLKGGALTTNGVPVVVTATATGYTGTAGGQTVFTLVLNQATGAYTYTQFKNLDHADNSNANDIITLTFGTKVVDYDGDSANAPIVINIKDDAPIFQPDGPKPDKGLETVDETNLGPVIETGKLDADFGADAPGSYAFKNGSFASSGSKLGGNLTHEGVPVVVTLENGIYVGKAGTVTVFTLELNASTGDYKFTLLDNFDHADATNPDDVITLDFGVIASDSEGEPVEGSIRINVKDDAPIANDDFNTYDTTFGVANGNVVTGLNGGPGAADDLSTDASNKVIKIAFGDNEIDVPATGTVSINGQYGTLTISSDGTYTYKAFENGGMVESEEKEFASGPALPDFDESQALDGVEQQSLGVAPGNLTLNGGETVTVTFVSEQASYGNTMGVFTVGADGKLKAETVLVKDGNAASAGQTFTYAAGTAATSLGFFIVADGVSANNGYAGIDFTKGGLNFVYDYGTAGAREATVTDDGSKVKLVYTGENGVETVINGPLYFSSDRGDTDNLNADGSVRVVSGIPGDDNTVLRIGFEDLPGLGDRDFNDIVFDVSITGKDCGCGDPAIKDQFTYTLQDGDGDTDKANLVLNGQDLTDDQPVLTAPAIEVVDETNLKDGSVTESGKIVADFGHDGPGTIEPNGSFTSGGSKLNGALTSNGVAVVVSLSGDLYIGKAGNVTVFTAEVKADGSYIFKLFDNLDHADGTNPNDEISLNFGIDAVDCDGDKTHTTLTVKVKDDAPIANDDSRTLDEGQTVTGNVITNDVPGQDSPATVTKVSFNGTTYNVPTNGTNLTVTGNNGTLTINKDGVYTYATKSNADGIDNFHYTLTDRDGDSDTAILSVCVNDTDTTPTIVTPGKETVDETNLKDGVITETGTITADFKDDAPGSFSGNNSFTSGGSKLNGNLTHNGTAVVVTQTGDTYTGVAGGVTVFTLQVAANGSYTFKLLEQLDHADGNNPNDVIDLNFGIKATDADGDSVATTLTVHVKDDAPVANNDGRTASEGQTITGNVTSNDVPGQDTPATVTKVEFGGTSYNVPATGTVVIAATNGTLTIDKSGAYTYVTKSNADGIDNFNYTLTDRDGDSDTACLSVCVTDTDTVPTIVAPAKETVDETNLKDGVITETGTVTADFKDDAPGSFSGNNSFTSGGSKLNGALTHNGTPVVVTYSGNTYTGTAGGVTVFTLQVATNGSYTFKLLEQLDHADGSNPNDVIDLNFGIKATDADGDSADTTLTVHVKDDAPVANDDGRTASEGQTITGNVTSNDVPGQDTPATVTKVSFNGVNYTVPATGTVAVIGANGTLTIDKTGAYTYVTKANADGIDNFNYTLTDRDGDSDTACLSICVTDTDTVPTIVKPGDEHVDETNLKDGAITETGTITADFRDDAPGTFAGNNSFTSGGSQLNGALTHNGTPVVVTYTGNTYTGVAGGVTVFTLQIAANGSYTFKLLEQLDHADGNNPNDVIDLTFGVKATDADGDSANTTLTVHVKDDAPVANDDGRNTSEGQTITGNVTSNDIAGQDTPATVTKVAFNGTTTNVPATGTAVIVGTYGTLTIDKTGAYSYVTKANADGIDNFLYTLKDRDGDTDTACLSICVADNDTIPTIVKPGDEHVDETNLKDGVITETGTITADFQDDAPGTFAGNNSFSSSGSKLNNALTHNGTPVTVAYNGNTYTGTAGGVTVFTLQIAANGSYTFKLLEQLDHADGNNPNDVIDLTFGVKATDADGDSVNTTLTVHVKDDAPVANDDSANAGEGQTITGNVTSNDVPGQDTPATVTKVTVGGTTYDVPATGNVVIAGTYGTLTIDKTGAYSYTAKSNNPDGTDNFLYTLKDRDGDTDTACLSIKVTANDDCPVIVKPADEIVDETNLKSGAITETGSVTANFFGDGPGTFAATNSFTSGGSRLNGALTHNGTPVVVTLNGNTYEGKAGSLTIFTMTIAANGSYTFKLFDNLDHQDGTNPNDVIDLHFGVKATDADGDAANTTITVKVKDDAPVANDDHNTSTTSPATGNVVTGLNGGPGAADVLSQDDGNKVVKVSFGGQTVDVPSTGTATIEGANGTLKIAADGSYTYTSHAGANSNGMEKTFVNGPALPDFDESEALDGVEQQSLGIAKGNLAVGEGDVISVKFVSEQADYSNTLGVFTIDASGKLKAETVLIQSGNSVAAGQSFSYTAAAGAQATGFFIVADGAGVNGGYPNLDFTKGSLDFVYKYGTGSAREATINDSGADVKLVYTAQNGTKTIIEGPTYFTSDRGDVQHLNSDGNVRVVSGLPDQNDNTVLRIGFEDLPGLGDKDFNDMVFDVSITNDDCGCNNSDVFHYTLKDGDGDTDTATLTLDCIPTDVDTTPMIIKPADEHVDETNLVSGVITETGTVTADFFADGPGTFAGNNSFASSGSRLNNALTHNGTPVTVAYNGNTYTGTAGGVTVFTLQIAANGSYTFKLLEQLDHADGNNPNDVIDLTFGVKATDADGDSAATTITVHVKDDAPDAVDDGRTTTQGETVTGNVTNNDVVGQDVPGTVTKVTFNGVTTNVPATGNAVIVGAFGTLTIDKTGAYSYVSKANADGIDNFVYTLKDRDNDVDTATLSICVADNDTTPMIIKPADEHVDETNLVSGVITETGTVTADFFADGPGTFAGNNSFASSGSRLNNALTHNGTPVTVAYNGNTYTGTAGGVTVFTLQIAANGSYTFKLLEQLDHADGNNPNDIIDLTFGVKATDADGDSAATTITVHVKDDAPVANDDGRITDAGKTITGNVTDNDVVGQDTPGSVIKIVSGGTTYDLTSANTVITTANGTLTINNTGAYTYVAKATGDGSDSFTYTLKDKDGDTDPAVLCIDVKPLPQDDTPIIIKPADEHVDETNLAAGVITETGTVTANFFNDGPGTFAINNSFTSSGSRLAGKLTSHGVDVVVTQSGNTYTGVAGGVTVFTMVVAASGAYTFKLFEQLDHADANDANDSITLNFGVKATDADGDTAATTITVLVKDDAPIAKDDACTVFLHEKQVSSNALTNDFIGQDTGGRISSITFGGTTKAVPLTGSVDIAGLYGILTIAASGDYTYKINNGASTTASENFTVKIVDYDGDTDTSNLQINVIAQGMDGTPGNDIMHGTTGNDIINGNAGDDDLWGEAGDDTIHGNAGMDDINGGTGHDTIYGDADGDVLSGREGNDTIYGGTGNDDIYGDADDKATYSGNDRLFGEDGSDYIYGGLGDDYIDGGNQNDALYGAQGIDTILGGAGNDDIIGGLGNDILTGGAGADTFWYLAINEGVDRIQDFNIAEGDKFELSNVLTNFDPVTDAINDFVFATHNGGDTTISVNNAGTGAAGATAIAVLENVNVSVSDLFNNGSIII